MVLRCTVCEKTKKIKVCHLIPTQGFIREYIHIAHCVSCKKDMIVLYSLKADGNTQKRDIVDSAFFLSRRTIDYIECPTSPGFGRWKKAKGYAYLKGYKFKNSTKGVILSLSDEHVLEKYSSQVV